MFINYFRSARRSTCLNLAIARIIICFYCIWKVSTFPFGELAAFPEAFFEGNSHAILGMWRFTYPWILIAEQVVAVVCLIFVMVGFRTGLFSFVAALVITHLAGLSFAVTADKTFLLPAYFLIFYGIYRTQDLLTVDHFRSMGSVPQGHLNQRLQSAESAPAATLSALKWLLLCMAAIYFFTGFGKFKIAGWDFDWAAAENIRLSLLHNVINRGISLPPLGGFLLEHPWILALMGAGTLLLELCFLMVVLCSGPITPFILGLAGMHFGILLTMHVNYLTDMMFVYAAFLAWDSLAGRLQRGRSLTIIYDDNCSLCLRVLLLLKQCDVAGGLKFVGPSSQEALPWHDYASAMYVFDPSGRGYAGYDGFVAVFSYLGLTRPLAWIMVIPPVAFVGRRLYRCVARTRSCVSGICRTPNHQDRN
jgi:predicted DCC family thiol-disulfide oxidoreductase YuxK